MDMPETLFGRPIEVVDTVPSLTPDSIVIGAPGVAPAITDEDVERLYQKWLAQFTGPQKE